MERIVDKEIDKNTSILLDPAYANKEQALVLINEAHDDLLERKIKVLMSKQFYDMTKSLGTL